MEGELDRRAEGAIAISKSDVDRLDPVSDREIGLAVLVQIGTRDFDRTRPDRKGDRRVERAIGAPEKDAQIMSIRIRADDVENAIVVQVRDRRRAGIFAARIVRAAQEDAVHRSRTEGAEEQQNEQAKRIFL